LAVVQVDRDGELVNDGELNWKGTIFEAAADAAKGEAWSRSWEASESGCWTSQGRLLDLSLDVLGLGPGQRTEVRHAVGEVLGVDTLILLEWARKVAEMPGYRSCGRAVVEVLAMAATRPGLLRRLLVTGHMVGRWGEPLWWDVDHKVLRKLTFRHSGTDPPLS
jgi:hypothetical protein